MAYKTIENNFSFADIAIQSIVDKNRSLIFLREINKTINWEPVQALLMKFYETGKTKEGERAYSPLLLFKCLLLQKWFQIKSDPELESQINDRISFKSFLSLPMDCPSPDHSTFSRFRKRLSKEAMIKANSELLNQFHQQGLSINEGLAVDARLVKSASRPVSNQQLEELKQKANTPEGKLDKNGQIKKYTRDLDSDWTIKNDKPHYGLKEHASVDTDHGFLSLNHIHDGIMRKDNINAKLTETEIARNKAISKFRYIVEQYFGISHLHDNGNRARFPKLMKNMIDDMFR